MKMEHYFKLPVNSVYPCAYVRNSRLDVTKAAAHAINCHDELVSRFVRVMEEYWLSAPDTAEEFEARADVIAARAIIAKAAGEH